MLETTRRLVAQGGFGAVQIATLAFLSGVTTGGSPGSIDKALAALDGDTGPRAA